MANPSKTVFQPIQRRRIHEDVADQLRDAILDGRFAAGTRLPPERELAEEFNVNRTSIREALKVLEGLGLVTVRQGDGATVQPLIDASIGVLPAMIFHGGKVDGELLAEMTEVITPLLFEMARLAIERRRPAQLESLRLLQIAIADETRAREERFASARDVLVLLSDMTRNRVWQMLARRTRALLAADPMRETRQRLRRDPGRIATIIATCLAAMDAGRPADALAALHRFISLVGDNTVSASTTRSPRAPLHH